MSSETEEFLQSLHKGKHLADKYAAYRPTYPQEVYDKIMTYHNVSGTAGHQLAVDVCCGTGQGTLPLTKYFQKVVGVDVSEDLIDKMPRNIPNLTSAVGKAEDLFMFEPSTVDLITIATAFHWVNAEKFFHEVKRILKPGGTLAVYSWLHDRIEDTDIRNLRDELKDTFGNFWTSRIQKLLDKYRDEHFPFQDVTRFDEILESDEMTIEQFTGLWESSQSYKLYCEANPGTDIMKQISNSTHSRHVISGRVAVEEWRMRAEQGKIHSGFIIIDKKTELTFKTVFFEHHHDRYQARMYKQEVKPAYGFVTTINFRMGFLDSGDVWIEKYLGKQRKDKHSTKILYHEKRLHGSVQKCLDL